MNEEADMIQMTVLIKQEKEVEDVLEEARSSMMLWHRRATLAFNHQRLDMARVAHDKAARAKREFEAQEEALGAIRHAKHKLLMSRRGLTAQDDHNLIQAEVLSEQFNMQGYTAEAAMLEEVAEHQEADLALLALKGSPEELPVANDAGIELAEVAALAPAVAPAPTAGLAASTRSTASTSRIAADAVPKEPDSLDAQLAALAAATDEDDMSLSDDELAAIEALERELGVLRQSEPNSAAESSPD